MKKQMSREEMYRKIKELNEECKNKSKTLKSKDGVFLLDPNDKYQKEWYENDKDYECLS